MSENLDEWFENFLEETGQKSPEIPLTKVGSFRFNITGEGEADYDVKIASYASDPTPALILTEKDSDDVFGTLSVNLSGYGAIPIYGSVFIDESTYESDYYQLLKDTVGLRSEPIQYGPFGFQSEMLEIKGLKEVLDKIYQKESDVIWFFFYVIKNNKKIEECVHYCNYHYLYAKR